MTVKITTEVHGLKELDKALRELREEMQGDEKNIVASALMSAALPVLRTAQSLVPVREGDLKRAIRRNRIKEPRAYSELITVGVPMPYFQSGKLANKKQGGHGQLVEFGTGLPKSRKPFSGEFQPPQPFLRPALESNRKTSVSTFIAIAGRKIEAAAKKIGNKNLQKVGARIKNL